MKSLRTYIYKLCRNLIVVMILISMGVQTSTKTLTLLPDVEFELVQVDIEDTTEGEEDRSEKTVQLYVHHYRYDQLSEEENRQGIETLELLCSSVSLDIVLPPPDVV